MLSEENDLDITTVALPTITLIPEQVEKKFREIVGANYCYLSELDRTILVLAGRIGKI